MLPQAKSAFGKSKKEITSFANDIARRHYYLAIVGL